MADADGGLRRSIGAFGLGATVFNTVVGAGIFVLPAALAREAGAATPLAYLACTAIMGAVALCFAAAGSRAPTSGGPVGYAEAAFGPFAGFLVGVLVWVAAALAAAGIVNALADAAARAAPAFAAAPARALVMAAVLAMLMAVNLRGARPGTRLVEGLTVLKLLPLGLLLAAGAWAVLALPAPAPMPPGEARFGRAMLLALFAFQGMETALGVSGEVRDPARAVPRGLLGAMACVAALYIVLQLVVQRLLGAALPASVAPLADAAARVWAPLGLVLAAGTAASLLGYLAGDVLSAPRTLYVFGRMGVLPKTFGLAGEVSGAPVAAILAHTAVVAVLALAGLAFHAGFAELTTLASLANVPVYIAGCAAAVVLQRRRLAQAGPPLTVPGLWIAALLGTAGMVWLAANAHLIEVVGLALFLGAGALLYAGRAGGRRLAAG
ncbi:MAG: APC family permease [Caulobacteraceae bacterium]|nr:APC family permease [Caulobacter sp.]